MNNTKPTVQELHLICAEAMVAMPTAKELLRGNEVMRPAMSQRIEKAMKTLGLAHLQRRPALAT